MPVDGYSIFALACDQIELCDDVAINQVWPNEDIKDYAVIAIDAAGIRGEIIFDNVAEATAPMHRVIKQELIEPQKLSLHRIRQLNYPHSKLQKLISKSELTAEESEIVNKWKPLLAAMKRGENPIEFVLKSMQKRQNAS